MKLHCVFHLELVSYLKPCKNEELSLPQVTILLAMPSLENFSHNFIWGLRHVHHSACLRWIAGGKKTCVSQSIHITFHHF